VEGTQDKHRDKLVVGDTLDMPQVGQQLLVEDKRQVEGIQDKLVEVDMVDLELEPLQVVDLGTVVVVGIVELERQVGLELGQVVDSQEDSLDKGVHLQAELEQQVEEDTRLLVEDNLVEEDSLSMIRKKRTDQRVEKNWLMNRGKLVD
jgi:hypothetical protein